jgi:hypothetical protein
MMQALANWLADCDRFLAGAAHAEQGERAEKCNSQE